MQTLNQASVYIMFASASLANANHQADNKGLELVWVGITKNMDRGYKITGGHF